MLRGVSDGEVGKWTASSFFLELACESASDEDGVIVERTLDEHVHERFLVHILLFVSGCDVNEDVGLEENSAVCFLTKEMTNELFWGFVSFVLAFFYEFLCFVLCKWLRVGSLRHPNGDDCEAQLR